MTQEQPRTPQSSKDRIVAEVSDKVEQRPSVEVPREEIEARVEQSVDRLFEQPVQTFTPLLAENQVMGSLVDERRQEKDGTGASQDAS